MAASDKQSGTIEKVIATVVLYMLFRVVQSAGLHPYFTLIFEWIVYYGLICTAWALIKDFRWFLFMRRLERPLGLEGNVKAPHVNDLIKAGLKTRNVDGQGFPIGSVNGRYLWFDGQGHVYISAATNGGKTESSAVPALMSFGVDRNPVVTAKGADLVRICAAYRKALGQDVYIIDPFGICKDAGLPTHDFNEIGHLPKLAAIDSPELIEKALKSAMRRIADDPNSKSDNKIFSDVARILLNGAIAYFAHVEADTGELACNYPHIQRVFSGSDRAFGDDPVQQAQALKPPNDAKHNGSMIELTANRLNNTDVTKTFDQVKGQP